MISVIKDWAEYIYQLKDKFDDFLKLLLDGLKKAMESLKMTTENLAILAKRNVVDAGAKGFVVFLEGMFDYFKNGQVAVSFENQKIEIAEAMDAIDHEEINFRYCTEALITGTNMKRSDFNAIMESYGDSMVVAGSDKKMRIHIHTDEPWKLFQDIAPLGTITYKKVDDMVLQNDLASNRKFDIGLITDSTCDLPMELIEKYQIQVIPLTVHFGQDFYLDRLTIQPQQFFDKLRKSDVYPTTAQPAISEFLNRYNYLATHYQSIISAHISSGMSGTWQNSYNAARKISNESGKQIDVIDSKKLSSGLGLIILRAAKAIESGLKHDEIVKSIPHWSDNTRILVTSRTMKYMVKSGRVSHSKGLLGKLLGIKPIVEVKNHGKTEVFGKPMSEKASMKMVMDEMKRFVGNQKVWGYSISHADNLETANWYAEQMKTLTGGQEAVFIQDASPVLVTNTGPGVVALSVMLE
jgi:DegV family protein with EDD domain